MEVKNFAIELKAADDARTVEGLGSVFNNIDNGNDVVLPGAFAKSIRARTPAMLWQHKSDQVIGVWDEVAETTDGLYVKGRILETQLGNDAYTLAKAGALKGMSIGYGTKQSSLDKKTGVRQLKELDLWEVSLVTFPMNEMAGITRVKSADGDVDGASELLGQAIGLLKGGAAADILPLLEEALGLLEDPGEAEEGESKLTPKTIERILREAGMSRSDARGVLAKGYTAIAAPREAGEHERLIHLLNQFKI